MKKTKIFLPFAVYENYENYTLKIILKLLVNVIQFHLQIKILV